MNAEVLTHHRFPPAAASLVFAHLLNRHSPHEIACAIEVLIDLLDIMEGDPDAETEAVEDDFTLMPADIDFGPGCGIADPAGQCDEDGNNTGWTPQGGAGCSISDPDNETDGDQ